LAEEAVLLVEKKKYYLFPPQRSTATFVMMRPLLFLLAIALLVLNVFYSAYAEYFGWTFIYSSQPDPANTSMVYFLLFLYYLGSGPVLILLICMIYTMVDYQVGYSLMLLWCQGAYFSSTMQLVKVSSRPYWDSDPLNLGRAIIAFRCDASPGLMSGSLPAAIAVYSGIVVQLVHSLPRGHWGRIVLWMMFLLLLFGIVLAPMALGLVYPDEPANAVCVAILLVLGYSSFAHDCDEFYQRVVRSKEGFHFWGSCFALGCGVSIFVNSVFSLYVVFDPWRYLLAGVQCPRFEEYPIDVRLPLVGSALILGFFGAATCGQLAQAKYFPRPPDQNSLATLALGMLDAAEAQRSRSG